MGAESDEGGAMSEREEQRDELTEDELEREEGEPLPDREAMSVIGDPSQWNLPPVLEGDA
jgi:hypothetical protein